MRSMHFLISMSVGNLLPKSVIATKGVSLRNINQSSLSELNNFYSTKLIYHRRLQRPTQWFVQQQNQAPDLIFAKATLFIDSELVYNLSMVQFQLLQTVLLGEKSYAVSQFSHIKSHQLKHSSESISGQTMTMLPQMHCFTIFHS